MLEKKDLEFIKKSIEDFFNKMTINISSFDISSYFEGEKEVVGISLKIEEPSILIGQGGQTLFELQKILRTILNKKLKNYFYFNIDINDYKKKKVEYYISQAKELADQVSLTREEKSFPPMSSYERRIIHAEISKRPDVIAESQGEGSFRHIVVKPKN